MKDAKSISRLFRFNLRRFVGRTLFAQRVSTGRSLARGAIVLRWALAGALTGVTQAQSPIPFTFTTLSLDCTAMSEPIAVRTNGTTSRQFSAGHGDEPVSAFGQASTSGNVDELFARVVIESETRPAPGNYAAVVTDVRATFGAATRVEAMRSPPFPLLPNIVPVTMRKHGFVEISGDLSVIVTLDHVPYVSRGLAGIAISVRGDDTSEPFDSSITVNSVDELSPDPQRAELNVRSEGFLRVGTIYAIGISAVCSSSAPINGGYVKCVAQIDPVFEFDQERFDAMAREQGMEPFKLSDYYTIAYSPDLPGPPLHVANVGGQIEISWSDGVLQSSTNARTGWVDLTNASPYRFDPGGSVEGHRFFRTRHGTGP